MATFLLWLNMTHSSPIILFPNGYFLRNEDWVKRKMSKKYKKTENFTYIMQYASIFFMKKKLFI